jgi:pilus assembly protein CpaE
MISEQALVKVGIIAQDVKTLDRLKQDLRTTGQATSVFEGSGDVLTSRQELERLKQTVPEIVLVQATEPSTAVQTVNLLNRSLSDPWLLVVSKDTDAQFIIETVRAGAREFLADPVSAKELAQSFDRYFTERRKQSHAPQGKLYCVTSAKGGAGATTVAINLATAQAGIPSSRVALIDLMNPLGDVAAYLNLKPEYSFSDVLGAGARLDPVLLETYMTHAGKIAVLPGPGEYRPAEAVDVQAVAKTLDLAREAYTHTVVDLPSSCDEDLLRMCSQMSDGFLIVLTPEIHALWRTHRLLLFLGHICAPEILKVVLNRSHKRDRITSNHIENTLGHPVVCSLPNDYGTAIESVNAGKPLVSFNSTRLARSYVKLAHRLAGVSAEPLKSGLLGILN